MSQLDLIAGLIKNLEKKIPEGRREFLSPEIALKKLIEISGKDFGYDSFLWKEWFKKHKKEIKQKIKSTNKNLS